MGDVKIRILSEDEATAKLNQVEQKLGEFARQANTVESSGKKSAGGLEAMRAGFAKIAVGAGAAGAAMLAIKKGFEFAEQGAEITYTEEKFNRLAAAIGTTGAVLKNDLAVATRGMVTDAQAMASATDMMSLGLATSREEAVRLTGVASALNMDMNQLVLTLTNQTTMRFDALGVSVDGFSEKVADLKAAGMDANSAFTEAFLQQAEAQIEKVGHAADSAVGPFKRLDVAVGNITDSLKQGLAPAAATAAEWLARLLMGAEKWQAELATERREVESTTASYDEYVQGMTALAEAHDLVIVKTEDGVKAISSGAYEQAMYNAEIEGTEAALQAASAEMAIMTEAQWASYQATQALDEALVSTVTAFEGYSDAAAGAAEAQDELSMSFEDLQAAINGKLGPAIEDFQIGMGDLESQADTLRTRIGELSEIPVVTPEQAAQIEGLRNELWETTMQIKDAETALSEGEWNKKKKLAAEENLESLRAKAVDLAGQIEALGGKSYLTEAQKQELADSQAELEKVEQAIIDTATAHEEATARILFGIAQQKLATNDARTEVSEFTEDELKLLGGLAEQWGLIDDATVAATLGMDAAMKAFAEGDIKKAMEIISAMYLKLTTMPTDIGIHIGVSVTGDPIPGVGGPVVVGGGGGTKAVPKGPGGNVAPAPPPSNSGGSIDGATGLNFVVPPGYPNDTFGPIYVQSGEHVQVTPAGRAGGSDQAAAVMAEMVAVMQALPGMIGRSVRDNMLKGAA